MKTAFHLITGDPAERTTALAIVGNLLDDDSVAVDAIAVVAQAGGIEPLVVDGDGSDRVRTLLDRGVSFRACGNTLDAREIDGSDLVPGVERVPSGAGELTRLQHDGYAYIRP
jgi:intracellular sulfur oxidation DsrE/DsrF family protein